MTDSLDLIGIRVAKTEDIFEAKPGELILFENTDGVNVIVRAMVIRGSCSGCIFKHTRCPRWGCGVNDVIFVECNRSELPNDTV